MAEIDTSIYSKLQQPDTFGQADKAAGIMNKMQQLELMKQQFNKEQLEMGKLHANRMQSYLTPLLSKKDLSLDDVHGAAAQMLSDPELLETAQGQMTIQNLLPHITQLSQNPVELRKQLLGMSQHYATLSGTLDQLLPKPQGVNTGGTTQFVDVNPLTNTEAGGMALRNTMTPREKSDLLPTVGRDPNSGKMVRGGVPVGSVFTPTGELRGGAEAIQAPMGRGDSNESGGIELDGPPPIDDAELFGTVPKKDSRVPPPPGVGSFIQQDFPPGYAESQTDLAKAGSGRYDSLVSAAQDTKTRQNVLKNILDLSKEGVSTGSGQEFQNRLGGLITNTPLLSMLPGMESAKDNLSKFSELKKFMEQNSLRNWQTAGGTGTNEQLSTFREANPNSEMFPKALQRMAQWNLASELALQAKADAQDAWKKAKGGDVSDQSDFENKWRKVMDQRFFQFLASRDDQEALKDLQKQIPNKERAEFRKKADEIYKMRNPKYWMQENE